MTSSSIHVPAMPRPRNRPVRRIRAVDVDDAIFTAVEERRMAAFGEIQELVGQDEIARLIVAVQGAYSRRRQDSRNAQALQAQDIGPVISVKTTFREKLAELGVIFCSFSEAVKDYPDLVKKYLGSVVSYRDNFFAALNSAVFSDGSFVYIPKGVRCPMFQAHSASCR